VGSGREDAAFRDGQEEAIRHVVEGRGRLLVVQKTGWGKSFVYFIATKLLREAGHGPAILVSPLLALMRNQLAAAERMGLRAFTINSENEADWPKVNAHLERDDVDILLVSPERFDNADFLDGTLSRIADRISLMVVDEAHCISDWGHDFRPHYRTLERIVRQLPPNVRVLATTATANDRVMADLEYVLGPHLHVMRGDLHRPSLTLQTIVLPDRTERLAWLADRLSTIPGSGIVFTLTVRDALEVAAWLKSRGMEVEAYTSDSELRPQLEDDLLHGRVKALIATTALGMGYDKPDLAFVIHFQMPGSVVHYYQQVGRAGRALESAYGVLLSGAEDENIGNWFIENAFPTADEVQLILKALENEPDGLSTRDLLSRVNAKEGRIKQALLMLSLESPAPVVNADKKWQLTAAPLGRAFWERAERLTALRKREAKEMRDYVGLPFGRHMQFLLDALDGGNEVPSPAPLPPLPEQPTPEMVREAERFLRNRTLPIEPLENWPKGGLSVLGVSGRIKKYERAVEGRALCRWRDGGWGELVRTGKYQDRRFADELVAACVSLVRRWGPKPAPAWVTCIPSRGAPDLVPDFARRLAAALGLPFVLGDTRN
jgi:ATP-dependent DNA helicase RecQ